MHSTVTGRQLLDSVAQTGLTNPVDGLVDPTFSASLTGISGPLSAVVEIYGTHDGAHWVLLGTLAMNVANWLSSADDAVDTFWIKTSWAQVRCNVLSITGNGAAVSAFMGA